MYTFIIINFYHFVRDIIIICSMIAKNFLFSFVNSYASFFFVAFFAAIVQKPTYPGQPPDDNIGLCGYPDCMTALAINLGIVLGTGIVVNGTVNVFLPYVRVVYTSISTNNIVYTSS